MSAASSEVRRDLYVPPDWGHRSPARDVALDMLRGLAMVILVVNHTLLDPGLSVFPRHLLSGAEVLVGVSGVVAGMVFGRRWIALGARATTRLLLRRAGKLYLASVVVVSLIGLATVLPGLGTEVMTGDGSGWDAYAFDGRLRTLLAIITLQAGPWEFNIMGFFVAALVAAPALLWVLARGWWPLVVVLSLGLYLFAHDTHATILPSQSESAFPVLVWQVLFVNGMVVGWHRQRIAEWAARRRRALTALVAALALAGVALQLGGAALVDDPAWLRWRLQHFDKVWLDPARLLVMTAITLGAYVALLRLGDRARRLLGRVLLPLGHNSFYVFIVHVFLCLALASVPVLNDADGLGFAGNAAVQIACVALMVELVRRRVLFRWIPR